MSIVFKKKSQVTVTQQVTDTASPVPDAKTLITDPNPGATTYAGKISADLDQRSTESNPQSRYLSRSNFTDENRPESKIKIDITKPKFASYAHNSISGIIKNVAEIFYRRLNEDPAKLSTWEDKGAKLKIFQENFMKKNKSWCKFIELVVESTTKIDKNNKNSKNDSTFDSDLSHANSTSKQKNAILLRLINAMFSYVLVDVDALSTNTCVFPDDVLGNVWKLVIGFNTSTDIWSHIIDKLKNESKLSITIDTKINSVISFIQQHYSNVAGNRFLISYIRVYLKNYEISLERKITFEVRVRHFVDILPDVFIVLDALYEIVNVLDSRHLRLLNEIQEIENNIEKNKKFIEVSNNNIKKLSDELDKYRTKNSKILGSTDKANETSRKNVMKKITEDENTIEKIKSDIQAVKKTNQELSANATDCLTQIEKIILDKQNVKISIENFTKNFYGMIDFDYFMHSDYAPYLDNGVIDVINQDRARIV